MARRKNFFVQRFNTRYIRYIFYKFLAKSKFVRDFLNLYEDVIFFGDLQGKNINIIKSGKDIICVAKQINNVAILGRSSAIIDLNSKRFICGHKENKVNINFFKPVMSNKDIIVNDSYCINLVGVHKGHRNFFHFFLDYFIPAFYFLKNFTDNQKITIIIRKNLPKVQQDAFAFLKTEFPNIEFLTINPRQKIICAKLYYLFHKHFFFYNKDINPSITKVFSDFKAFFLNYYNIKPITNPQKLTYISRLDAKLRRVKNEKEFFAKLQSYNFELYQLSKLSFKQQVELFANSKVVIGAHGAGFTNLLFAPRNCLFIEIFPNNYYDAGYVMLANSLNIRRYQLKVDNGGFWEGFSLKKKDFENIDSILKKL